MTLLRSLSHFLSGRHQTSFQAVTHQALTQDRMAAQNRTHPFSVTSYPCLFNWSLLGFWLGEGTLS